MVLKAADEPRNKHQSVTLLEAIAELGLDACIGGVAPVGFLYVGRFTVRPFALFDDDQEGR